LLVEEVSEITIVEVPALSVKFVGFVLQRVPVPFNVQVPEPIVKVRVFELELEKSPVVTLLPFASKVPLLKVRVLELKSVKSPDKVKAPPNIVTVAGQLIVIPPVVKVRELLPAKVKVLVPLVLVIPLTRVNAPKTDAEVVTERAGVLRTPVKSIPAPSLDIFAVTV